MKLIIPSCQVIIVTFLLLAASSSEVYSQSKNCKTLDELVVEPSWKQSGTGKWTLTLKFDDSRLGRYAIMIGEQGKEVKVYKNREKEIEDLKTGVYELYIVDKNGCSKQLNLNIK